MSKIVYHNRWCSLFSECRATDAINDADPGVVKRTYCTLDYLMEHLDKAEVKTKVQAWRDTLRCAVAAAFPSTRAAPRI